MIENSEQLKDFIIRCLEEKQADNIVPLDLSNKSDLAKYMIVASGRSIKNIGAIADYILMELKLTTNFRVRIEGLRNSEWVLLDAGDVILHLFCPAARDSYMIEQMWN